MKFPAFDYACPASLDDAVALLAARPDEAMLLAGGQSLLPILAFRMAAPQLIVDLKNVPGLDEIRIDADGVHLGARVRWREIERDDRLRHSQPLLVAAVRHIAHYQVRNRGTVGGSVALADPAAELPGVVVACDGEVTVTSARGERTIAAGEFFLGPMTSALAADEIVTQIRLPTWPEGRRWGFQEFARRRGDFALAGIALHYDLDDDGLAQDARIAVFGASDRPHRLQVAEAEINGTAVDADAVAAASVAASEAVDPMEDHHAPAAYRRALVATMLERAFKQASA